MRRSAPVAASAGVSSNLETLLRRYARRSRHLRATWRATTDTTTNAQGLLAALVREAVTLISVEGSACCPYDYVLTRLELCERETHPITVALSNALVHHGLAIFKDEQWRDIWANRDGSYYSAGAIGDTRQYVTLMEKGQQWAAVVEEGT